MSKAPAKYKLEMKTVLSSIDRQQLDFYEKLTDEEQKAYSPFVIMRYMSSMANRDPAQMYAILATNDLVNIGFSDLNKHPELQHKLLCCAGVGDKQYRPWIPAPKGKRNSQNSVMKFLAEIYPQCNSTELDLMYENTTTDQLEDLAYANDVREKDTKEMLKVLADR
jgi:hypothetical protein